MKIVLSFWAGVMVCSLLLFGASTVLPTMASDDTDDSSDNLTQSLLDLMPDIEQIYETALTSPFIKAEEKIYDEDIAEYYHELIYNSLLSESDDGAE